jgi:hypothetical protein
LPIVPGFFVAEHEGRYWTVGGLPGLLIPVRDCQGRIVAVLYRPDEQTEGGKYRWLSSKKRGGPGPGAPIHVPLFNGDKSTVRITEGALKADIATHLSGVLTIGLPGINSVRRVPALLKQLGAKIARVALDADAARNKNVGKAMYNLIRLLKGKGFGLELETWDEAKGKGIDDLLAAGHQPTLHEGETAILVASGIAGEAGVFNDPSVADPVDTAPMSAEGSRSALDIIRHYFRDHYRPSFRRGPVLYSEAEARDIKHSEACFAPDPPLVEKLAFASDCPRNDNGIMRSLIPKLFKTWAPVAWRGVLAELPEEETTAEVVGSAKEGFWAQVAAGLHTHVVLGYRHQGTEETSVERRPLIQWAGMFAYPASNASPGKWANVRGYLVWGRRDARDGPLRVALRVGAFTSGQGYQRSLAEMSQYSFAQKCELYGVGTAQRACGQRVVELTPEFIADLLQAPAAETAEPQEQPPIREPGEEG